MKSTDIVQPQAMPSVFAEDVFSASGSADFVLPDATSTSATDTCVMDDGFLPITSEPLDDGGIAPERKNFNGLFYLSTDQRVFLQNGGFITFNANVSSAIGGYPQGAILGNIDSTGRFSFVKSLIDDNTYNFVATPSYIDDEHWSYASLKVDLTNADPAQSFIDMAVGWGMPDYSTAISTGSVNGSSNAYTILYNCFCIVQDSSNATGQHILNINGVNFPYSSMATYESLQVPYGFFYLSKGDVVYTNVSATLKIIKLKGEG